MILGYQPIFNIYNVCILYRKPPNKRNPIIIHLNLCIALALGIIVFVSGIETATDNEACVVIIIQLV